ncbi:MAG: S-methyl-5'-thioadenosine phosphorylase [Chloroflexota bacterium]
MPEASVAVIGGSGFYQIEGLTDIEEVYPNTPFGRPSDSIVIGTLEGRRVAFLPRHGRGHRHSPTVVPARANIFALKQLGVQQIISVSAVGSMREEYAPLDVVIPDQLFDHTKRRVSTFFDDDLVVHVGFANPFCTTMIAALYQASLQEGAKVHRGGTYLCIEGPQFSSRAESAIYRQWGVDIIGMTAIPEAKLAREAEICYAALALVTDYDVWHVSEQPVTVEMVIQNLQQNVALAKRIVKRSLPLMKGAGACECSTALRDAIITERSKVSKKTREKLAPIIGKYL